MIDSKKIVDIIIPVYNALEDLKDCLNSLLEYTTYPCYRIIIINDCSPDPGVKKFLETVNDSKIIILENEKNVGFVATVNKGMAYSNNDVVLLNSDTVVTENWLEKITNAAYLDRSIGTVTPLTNNGTICSVPNFCEDNEIPKGYTVQSFAKLIEKISLKEFPEIPTGVGFCMYIKRTVIEKVGLFDNVTFGRGYGEENDFCCKTTEAGFKNILADDTFIYHTGSMSFKEDKRDLITKNLKKLNERYPYYEGMVHQFIVTNPLKRIHENLHLQMKYYENHYGNSSNILFVLHNFFDEMYNHPIGGTEFHVEDIVKNLDSHNCFVMVSNTKEIVIKKYISGEFVGKYRFELKNPIQISHFTNLEYKQLVEKILTHFEIDLVHIHHLKTHTFDVPKVAKDFGLKVIYTLHDFYSFCPKINLLDENYNYCINERGEMKCKTCLKTHYPFHTYFVETWKNEVEKMFEYVDLFITPSESTKSMFEDEFKDYFETHKNIIVIEHGIDFSKESGIVKEKSSLLKVGFLGGLSPVKGSNMIYQLIKKYPSKNVEWHLIGELGDQRLNLLSENNIFKHGKYKREDLNNILVNLKLDVILFLSPWPETYSYTLTETWNSKTPVLVLPLGALDERVNKVKGGWVTKGTKLTDVIEMLQFIENLPTEELLEVVNNIANYQFKNKEIMVHEYKTLYAENIRKEVKISKQDFTNEEIVKSQKYYIPTTSGVNLEQYNNELTAVKDELLAIKNTIGWKILEKARSNFPSGLNFGKKVIKKVLHYKK